MPFALCGLTMTGQPAIEVGIFFLVTRDTLTHTPNFLRQPVQILHLRVALLAGDFVVDVALVIEQDMLGHIVDLNPGRWRAGVKVFVLLFDPGMVGNNILVTMQAFFHFRYSRMIGIGHVGMTVLALDLFYAAVNIMAERDGLLRSYLGLGRAIEKENKCRHQQSGSQSAKNGDGVFTQWFKPLS